MRAYVNSINLKEPYPVLFLDRDGVINFDHGHVFQIEKFDLMPGIFDLIRLANKKKYLVIVVTNQAGIAKNFYTEKQFHNLTLWMIEFFKDNNLIINGVYYSPFHPTLGKGKYLLSENTRKPGSGMFEEAFKDFNIDKENSIMIGDNISDIEASKGAGIKNNILLTNSKDNSIKNNLLNDVNIISSLSEAQPFIR